ncbi:hypothetical protein PR048_003657 [Dryococelus australis]|uniref:HTH psq-type domain-containing protein n=1 Tax=Dryococelus australis TaxID=614101 RepID=A0ABQ9IP93_9NEOP|nr:hypothetical protein PR048_003657 [Dryococelus australis]
MQETITAVRAGHMTQKTAADHFEVPLGTLAKKLLGHASEMLHGAGRPTELLKSDDQLATFLKASASYEDGLTKIEVLHVIQNYIVSQNLKLVGQMKN